MSEKSKFNERRMVGALCQLAHVEPKAIFEVMLTTGKVLEGELSPIDEDADYIRVNPRVNSVSANTRPSHTIHVPLAHIVYVQRKWEQP